MHSNHADHTAPETHGKILHSARLYDMIPFWSILTLGRGNKIWESMLDRAGLQPGGCVLDVGCGPGALTRMAKRRVGESGEAVGIDASPEMIAVARDKAERAGAAVDFRLEVVEKLPFSGEAFDAVLSSLMMHHLPEDVKRQGLSEIHRVLKPGGRLVVLDFKRPETRLARALLPAMHRDMPVGVQDLPAYLQAAGFEQIELSPTLLGMFGCLSGAARK